jgi:hypothetical protein
MGHLLERTQRDRMSLKSCVPLEEKLGVVEEVLLICDVAICLGKEKDFMVFDRRTFAGFECYNRLRGSRIKSEKCYERYTVGKLTNQTKQLCSTGFSPPCNM